MPATGEEFYYIRAFEVENELIDAEVYLSEEPISRRFNSIAVGADELRSKLQALGVRLDQLAPAFKSNYPL